MEQLLCKRANEFSDYLAIVDGQHHFTYHELLTKAGILASDLLDKGFSSEEPVGIIAGPGWHQVIAQVAVLRAGGSSTPIDPSVPDAQLHSMLSELDVRFVMTTNDLSARVSQFEVLSIEAVLDPKQQTKEHSEIQPLSGKPEGHRSHILHTSGSTGKPKAVQISSKAILHLTTSLPLNLEPGDRIGELNNPGFDLSLFEIWVALLSGCTVVHIPNSNIKDPVSFPGFLKDANITAIILPFALFNAVSVSTASAFKHLRHVITAGESPSYQTMQSVLSSDGPPQNLWNGYGPTETTCLSTLQRVTLQETESKTISAGLPIGNTVIHLLNDNQKPVVEDGLPGEICIGGPGLSVGYLNHPEANAEKFIEVGIANPDDSGQVETVRLYRTGDIGTWKGEPNVLHYIGREDLQVKRQGFRVELEEIERSIASNNVVEAVACVYEKANDSLGSDRLTAFVVPANDAPVDPQAIIEWTQNRHPYYMVPDHIRVISEIPLNSRGKVDRVALEETIKSSEPSKSHATENNDDPLGLVTGLLEEILAISDIQPDANILALGLSSLQIARFLGLIKKRVGTSLSMQDLYTNPTVDSIASRLHQANEMNYGPSELLQFEADSHLADDIQLVPEWPSEGRVFLTGATGFVGINLLYRFLYMSSIKAIACLTRGTEDTSPLDRIKNTFKQYDLWNEHISSSLEKVIVLDGDMTQDGLGLSENDYQWLIGWAPAIFHSAAKVNWCDTYSGHYAQNVLGTRNVLRVAAEGRRKVFHYISTIDVWAVTGLILGTEIVSEDGPLKVHLASLPFDTGYAQSQWVADEMVQRVRDKGLPVVIYRPGFIVGDSKTGAGNPDDFFSRMIIGCIKLGYWPQLEYQNQGYVTVDYVCDLILHIASSNRSIGRAFTLSAPNKDLTTNMEELCALIRQAGFPLEQISYKDWLEKLQAWDALESSPLLSLMPLLAEPVLRDATRLQTSKYTPTYDCTNTLEASSSRDDISFTRLTSELIKKFIDFWVSKGLHSL
jgi:amino acid adenylation domain-containing protein/thioester reductase-like protein